MNSAPADTLPEIVLVTGATAGLGAAIVRRFAAGGARVIAAGRRAERLETLRDELGGPARVRPLTLDVRRRAAVQAAFADLPLEWAAVDVLVNNAGLALGREPAHQTKLDDWDQMVDTNVKGLMYCTRAVLPGMVARDRGHIVNVGSTAAKFSYPGGNVYGGTKAFVAHFSQNLRADLVGTAVRVTLIEPGMTGGTEFSDVRFGDPAKVAALYAGTDPLTAEDTADAVFWAATRPARVNVNSIQLMPVCQAPGPFAIHRRKPPEGA